MRIWVGAGGLGALLLVVAVACGGGIKTAPPTNDSLDRLAGGRRQAQLIFGTSDYGAGRLRISFLLARPDGSLILTPRARLWIAADTRSCPVASTVARLETVTAPGARVNPLGTESLYVAHVDIKRAGNYTVLIETPGSPPFAATAPLRVKDRTSALPVGTIAPASVTPKAASARGRLRTITTRVPPDVDLLRFSVKDSLDARRPFVLVFASPAFCPNRTCGPIVDVVEAARRRFQPRGVRFIHVEPFAADNPGLGFNRWAREWHIPGEPYTFLVGRDARIKAEFEGSLSIAELSAAIQAMLVRDKAR